MRFLAISIVGCAACTTRPALPPAELVQQAQSGPVMGTSAHVTLAPTLQGAAVLVAVAVAPARDVSASDVRIESAAGVAHPIQSTIPPACSTIYVAAIEDAAAGAEAVDVTFTAAATFSVAVLEFTGTSGKPYETAGQQTGDSAPNVIAPALDTVRGQLVISALATCGTITGLATNNPFTTVAMSDSSALAYFIANRDGTYGAAWTYTGGAWTAWSETFE